jgi:uncharacterized protein YjeT (DUF2065 family)
MTNSPLERAALALEDALRHDVSGLPPQVYREAVRRVFQAIREPSDEMLDALGFVRQRHFAANPGANVWRDVIDVLLDEH